MRIRWTLAAAADLEHIKDYLTEHSPRLAQSTVLERSKVTPEGLEQRDRLEC